MPSFPHHLNYSLMITLSAAMQQSYDDMVYRDQPKAAWHVIQGFFKEYSLQDAEHELWDVFSTTLIANGAPNANLPEERRCMLAFYEHIKILMQAAHVLLANPGAGKELPATAHPEETAASDPTDDIIINTIIAVIQPEAIYRLPAINNSEHMKLVIVIPDKAQKQFHHYEMILELVGIQYSNGFHYFLHCTAQLHKLIANEDVFYITYCTRENRIYDNGPQAIPVTPTEKQAALKEKRVAGFTTSFGKALVFMDGAKQFEQRKRNVMAAFMLNQCIVFSIKAMIQVFTGEEHTSNHMEELLEYMAHYSPVLKEILPQDTEEEKEIVSKLSELYLECTYKIGYTVSTTWLTIFFNKATEVLETVGLAGKEILQITAGQKRGNTNT